MSYWSPTSTQCLRQLPSTFPNAIRLISSSDNIPEALQAFPSHPNLCQPPQTHITLVSYPNTPGFPCHVYLVYGSPTQAYPMPFSLPDPCLAFPNPLWILLGNSKGRGNPWGLGVRVPRGRGGGCQLLTPQPLCQNPWHPCDPWADIPPYTSSSTITIIINGTSMLTNDNATISSPTTAVVHPLSNVSFLFFLFFFFVCYLHAATTTTTWTTQQQCQPHNHDHAKMTSMDNTATWTKNPCQHNNNPTSACACMTMVTMPLTMQPSHQPLPLPLPLPLHNNDNDDPPACPCPCTTTMTMMPSMTPPAPSPASAPAPAPA